jgi:hypothetical protein
MAPLLLEDENMPSPLVRIAAIAAVFTFAAYLHAQGNGNKTVPPVQPVSQLSVYDAKGIKVGGVVGFGSGGAANTALTINTATVINRLVVLTAHPGPNTIFNTVPLSGSGVGTFDVELDFSTPNCTGIPYAHGLILSGMSALTPITLVNSGKLYAPDGPLQETVSYLSNMDLYGQCHSANSMDFGQPVKLFFDLNTQFGAPFFMR